jgi:hypothetical protein
MCNSVHGIGCDLSQAAGFKKTGRDISGRDAVWRSAVHDLFAVI